MQYGFRPARPCEINAQNAILNLLSQNELFMLLLIDFSKAFDLIEHKILIRKLEQFGIGVIVLQWFKSDRICGQTDPIRICKWY